MKPKRWLLLLVLILIFALAACGANEETGSDAKPESSQDKESSAESTAAQSQDEDDADDDLLDAEAMIENLGDYLLRPEDLSNPFSIPEGGEQRLATIRLIQNMGEIEAKTYVNATDRIDGWWLELRRKNKDDFVPSTIESSLELFESAKGARKAGSPDYYPLYQDERREYSPVPGGCNLGDTCKFFYSEREDATTETIVVEYIVAYTYRNSFVWVLARGFAFDTEADFVLKAAEKILTKLESAPTK